MLEENSPGSIDQGFYLQWVFATGISMAIGMGGSAMAIAKINSMGALIWGTGLLGILPGVAQALVLRRYITRVGWWILATVGGSIVTLGPAALTYRVNIFISDHEANKVTGFLVLLALVFVTDLMYGFATGAMQWLVLRNQVARPNRWILVSTEGWAVGITVGLVLAVILYFLLAIFIVVDQIVGLLDLYYYEDTAFALTIGFVGAIVGVIAGAITGRALRKLLQETATNDAGQIP
ncbi:MAG TPA: hypothetical protein G4O11_12230 [Anaerolineae bacterium]|nr:hypothetical protein [Anaerolineae bacterium]